MMPSARQPAPLVIAVSERHHPGQPHAGNGFLWHLLTTDTWLGVIVIIAIVLAGLMLAMIKATGRILSGTPWYVRLALLASAGLGISWLLGRNRRTPSGSQDA